MIRRTKIYLFICFVFFSLSIFSQSKNDLENEKSLLEDQINQTNKQISKEEKRKNSALIKLRLSNKKIDQHKKLIKNLKRGIDIQNSMIIRLKERISLIEENILNTITELDLSKNVLSKLIYQNYIWKNTFNESFFLITSKDVNQLFKRKKYLSQLTLHKSNQIDKIQILSKQLNDEKEMLEFKKRQLEVEKVNKEKLLSVKNIQTSSLEKIKSNRSSIFSEIKKNESLYRKKLQNQKFEAAELDRRIRKIIEEEIRKSREEAKNNNSETPLTPESLTLSSNFAKNIGNLPWPLSKGIIISNFGIQKNQAIPGIETNNNGIDFRTDEGEIVRVVFDGIVSRIFFIKGKGKAVLVNHGNYFTVYSGLKDVVVKTGDDLISKQKIGIVVSSESSGKSELHFEIWKGKETQNPVKWLYKVK